MQHPTTAPGDWKLEYIVYPGGTGEIAVGVLRQERTVPPRKPGDEERIITHRKIGLRWCEGDEHVLTWQEGAQDWFVIPFTFAVAITRSLLQMKATGCPGFDETGLQKLIEWMSEEDAVDFALCY